MKTNRYQRRFYRDWGKSKDLHQARIITRDTDLEILTDKPIDRKFVEEKIRQYRWQVENYITRDSRFLSSLKPIPVELTAAPIVKEMAQAAARANVGPMAAVAGAIAEFVGKDLLKKGYKDVIIENGGDIFIKTRKSRIVGIYAGRSKLWNKLKLKIRPKNTPMGICTSSGKIGHSLSFGCVDSVVILSKSTSLADAAATAAANMVKSRQELRRASDYARTVKGVSAAVLIFGNDLISWGKTFEFVK